MTGKEAKAALRRVRAYLLHDSLARGEAYDPDDAPMSDYLRGRIDKQERIRNVMAGER